MGRKTVEITINDDGRDKGKTFLIEEMPAMQAEAWATRALFLLVKSGASIPESLLMGGMASMATMSGLGVQALLYIEYDSAKPLLDELMGCVKIKEPSITRKLTPDDVEETQTFFTLRGEALKLHIGFFLSGAPST